MRGPEAKLQDDMIKWLKKKGCKVIKKTATGYGKTGEPDILFFKEGFYGAIEMKATKNSKKRPGQQENIDWFSNNSYGAFCYKENIDKIKKDLEEIL